MNNGIDEALAGLGEIFRRWTDPVSGMPSELSNVLAKTKAANPWFTEDNVLLAFRAWAGELSTDKIHAWLHPYRDAQCSVPCSGKRTIGIVNAGNIPLVGLHDMLCVLASGNRYLGKNSSNDPYLLTYVAEQLCNIHPAAKDQIIFTDRLQNFDAAIATGSNNSARYFEYYFRDVPHIIRMNRNGVALLDGNETSSELEALGEDVFTYFGLGCRNVSHLVVPENYDFTKLLDVFEKFAGISQHHKYMNNYNYYKTILLMKNFPFYDNGFLLVKQDDTIPTPVAVLNYHIYKTKSEAETWLSDQKNVIQCVVSSQHVPFGKAQYPALNDYADGVDTMEFLYGMN